MKALVFHAVGDIRFEKVADPKIQEPYDAIVKITGSAICGTDLHLVRGTLGPMKPGTILGHEAIGIVEEVGKHVRNLSRGDRVVIPSTIACGNCVYCRLGSFSQCNHANPNGPSAGTAFFGGPEDSGPFHGLQAEYARVPFANIGLVKIPDEVTDDQAVLLSDIFPTGFMAAELAEIQAGDTVAVLGCGPVGQFAITSARHLGAGRIFAIDCVPTRLSAARSQGAEVINFDLEDPIEVIQEMTGKIGAFRVIDAVGVDSEHAHRGPAAKKAKKEEKQFEQELEQVASEARPKGDHWHPGDAPSQALNWATEIVSKTGTISIVGVYPTTMKSFPIGEAMNKNLRIRMGNCDHRRYIPRLMDMVRAGITDPAKVLTQDVPLLSVLEAYDHFDKRDPGWLKVKLEPGLGKKAA